MSKEKPTIKDVEKYCSCDYGIIVCPGCNGEKESELGTCAGCDGSGIRTCGKCEGLKVNKKLLEKPTIKDVEKYCSCDYGIIVCPGCNGEKESELGTCAGCDGSGIRTRGIVTGKL